MRQNITVALDKALVRKLRVIAASRSTSISGMLSEELKRIVEQSERYETAMRSALADLDQGFDLGGRPAARDELHDREVLR
jgi:predicted transcriptional regulator